MSFRRTVAGLASRDHHNACIVQVPRPRRKVKNSSNPSRPVIRFFPRRPRDALCFEVNAAIAFVWSATLPEPPADSAIWFDSDAIIDRRPNPLLAAKVSLGCLNRDMSQQELDLLQFAS